MCDPSSNKLVSPKMEPCVARGRRCQRQTVAKSDSRRKRSQSFKLFSVEKKNHLQNYVDSPLCREHQLISCSRAGSWVPRGRSGGVCRTLEGGLASEGNAVCPLVISHRSYWLATPTRLLARFANLS